MLSMGSSPLKTQVMSLRSIITDLSSRPNIISSLLWVFSPHRLAATSLHFLSMLHTKWASNESCLLKNTINLRIFGGSRNTFHILSTKGVTIGNGVLPSSFAWGMKFCPNGYPQCNLLGKFNDSPKDTPWGHKKIPQGNLVLRSPQECSLGESHWMISLVSKR